MTESTDLANALPPLDPRAVARIARRAAAGSDDDNWLARELARRMDERLDLIRIAPQRVLDLGCGGGADLARLQARYPNASVIGLDRVASVLAPAQPPPRGLLHKIRRIIGAPGTEDSAPRVAADARCLPLQGGSISLIWSNLLLHWLDQPSAALAEARRVLAVDGLMMFTTLGPDTLRELREAMPTGTSEPRLHRFIDMHDLGDTMVQAGFVDPVMDMEMLTVTYTDVERLFAELRTVTGNARHDRPRGLTGHAFWAKTRAALQQRINTDGHLSLSIELIQGHAWKGAPRTTTEGDPIIRFHPRNPTPTTSP